MLQEAVDGFIRAERLLAPGQRVLVGLSGGVDSVVLLHVLHRLGFACVAGHVHHGLRGAEADADAEFAEAVARGLEVPFAQARVEVRAAADGAGGSVQAVARRLRYRALARLAREAGCAAVAVAHHRDDLAETVLLHLGRGTGLDGLAGMRARRRLGRSGLRLVRPLLDTPRRAVIAFAQAEGLAWREDPSNASDAYRRNALRRQVVPALEAVFGPDVLARVAAAARHVAAYRAAEVGPLRRRFWREVARADAFGGVLDAARLARLPAVWRGRLLLDALRCWLPQAPADAATARRLEALMAAQPGRRLALPGGGVWREAGRLRFIHTPPSVGAPGALAPGMPYEAAIGAVLCEVGEGLPAGTLPPTVWYLDADAVAWPLLVRPWAPGDRLQPWGMEGTKKVSDLLTEARWPAARRAEALVVADGTHLVGVLGVRRSTHAPVGAGTRRVAAITFLPAEQPGDAAPRLYPEAPAP